MQYRLQDGAETFAVVSPQIVQFWGSAPRCVAQGSVTQGTAFYFLSYFSGLESVAMYSLGMKIAQIPYMMVILPFQTAYEPFVYGQKDTAQLRRAISRLLSYLLVAFAFVAFAVLFFTPGLLQLIAPPQYAGAWIVVLLIL